MANDETISAKDEFFYRQQNPFHDLDSSKQAEIIEAEEELEINVLLGSKIIAQCRIFNLRR